MKHSLAITFVALLAFHLTWSTDGAQDAATGATVLWQVSDIINEALEID